MSPPKATMREQLLSAAISLVQTHGFHGFSYRDLAAIVGIRTASIHYHFPSKTDLGRAVLRQHRQENAAFLARVDAAGGKPRERLRRYFDAFRECYGDGTSMCLAGIMAMDAPLLPPEVVAEIEACYADHERWLTRTLRDGRRTGDLHFEDSAPVTARALFDTLEGSLLASRIFRQPHRLNDTINAALRRLAA